MQFIEDIFPVHSVPTLDQLVDLFSDLVLPLPSLDNSVDPPLVPTIVPPKDNVGVILTH